MTNTDTNEKALSHDAQMFLKGYDACMQNVKQYFTIAKLMGAEKVNTEQVLMDSLRNSRETAINAEGWKA